MIVRAVRRTAVGGVARAALVPAAAFAVHQLRFVLAFGHASAAQLTRTGHSYMHSLVPWLVALAALAVGGFLCGLGRAFSGQRSVSRYSLSLLALWVVCSVCLVGLYVAQETLEGLAIAGHPAGLAGVFGYGGWWAVPSAAAVGLVLAAILHGARWALDAIARHARALPASRRPARAIRARCSDVVPPRLQPLADGWSGRGPPR
jgi:hypothetical protein